MAHTFKDVTPSFIYNKLKRLNITTLEDVVGLTENEFVQSYGAGSKSVKIFNDFKQRIVDCSYNIETLHASINEACIDLSEYIELTNIQLVSLEGIVPRELIAKFVRYKIQTIGDLSKMTVYEFGNLPGIGQATLNMLNVFVIDLKKNPIRYIECSKKPINKILKSFEPNIAIIESQSLTSVIMQYLEFYRHHNERAVLYTRHYYGLNLNKIDSLSEISKIHGISTERVRQLIQGVKRELKRHIFGKCTKLNM